MEAKTLYDTLRPVAAKPLVDTLANTQEKAEAEKRDTTLSNV